MENINCYLKITVILLAFFAAVVLYLKFIVKKQSFDEPKEVKNKRVTIKRVDDIITEDLNLNVEDTRYQYPYKPPVNPIVRKSILKKTIPVSSDLYTPFNHEYSVSNSDYHVLTDTNVSGTNELNYSGGETELIKIPLQMNVPNSDEQLRSQLQLITPYNKIKYGNC